MWGSEQWPGLWLFRGKQPRHSDGEVAPIASTAVVGLGPQGPRVQVDQSWHSPPFPPASRKQGLLPQTGPLTRRVRMARGWQVLPPSHPTQDCSH